MRIENKNNLRITNWESYQIIKTYKGQTQTDTDKTRQNKKMRVMICLFFFFQNRKAKDS